jgi:hypothetical protein
VITGLQRVFVIRSIRFNSMTAREGCYGDAPSQWAFTLALVEQLAGDENPEGDDQAGRQEIPQGVSESLII